MSFKEINWKKVGKRLLFPPLWVIVLLTIVSAVLLILVFAKGWETHPVAYAVYVLSAYWVTVLTVFCVVKLPDTYRRAREKIYANEYGNRYFTDAAFKTRVLLYGSLGVNLLYVLVNFTSGIYYHTAWFAILAVYYAILAIMRFLLVRYVNRVGIGTDPIKEYRRARLCGIILMSINLTLSGAVLMILYQNKGYEYHGMLIYVMAAYTFYITVNGIVNLVKYRKYNSPVLSVTKVISMSAALVSMLSLETAMLSQFGAGESPEFRRIMIAATGAGVSVIVIALSVYTIVRANRQIRRLRAKV